MGSFLNSVSRCRRNRSRILNTAAHREGSRGWQGVLGNRRLHFLYALDTQVADCVPLERLLTTHVYPSFFGVSAIFSSIFGKLSQLHALHLLQGTGLGGVDQVVIACDAFVQDSVGRLERGLRSVFTRGHDVVHRV